MSRDNSLKNHGSLVAKATPGQSRSAPRKRANQLRNRAWWRDQAALFHRTVEQMQTIFARQKAAKHRPYKQVHVKLGGTVTVLA